MWWLICKLLVRKLLQCIFGVTKRLIQFFILKVYVSKQTRTTCQVHYNLGWFPIENKSVLSYWSVDLQRLTCKLTAMVFITIWPRLHNTFPVYKNLLQLIMQAKLSCITLVWSNSLKHVRSCPPLAANWI